jgi:uncharacterized membrane-anchored protein YhcB (DUF1043 family)
LEYATMNWELIGIGVLAALAIVFIVKRLGGG